MNNNGNSSLGNNTTIRNKSNREPLNRETSIRNMYNTPEHRKTRKSIYNSIKKQTITSNKIKEKRTFLSIF